MNDDELDREALLRMFPRWPAITGSPYHDKHTGDRRGLVERLHVFQVCNTAHGEINGV